jgi:hypothetical protein
MKRIRTALGILLSIIPLSLLLAAIVLILIACVLSIPVNMLLDSKHLELKDETSCDCDCECAK